MAQSETDYAEIIVENVRLSYFYGFEPYQGKNYCTHLIFGSDHPQLPKLKEIQRKVAQERWKEKSEGILEQLQAQDKLFIHKGSVNKPGIEAYKGKLFISANRAASEGMPQLITEDRKPANKTHLYSGCRANVMIRIWAQDNKEYGKRINASLLGIQRVGDDERLSGGSRTPSASEFGVVPKDADGAAPAESESNDSLV